MLVRLSSVEVFVNSYLLVICKVLEPLVVQKVSCHLGWILDVGVGRYLVWIGSIELTYLDMELSFKFCWADMAGVDDGVNVFALAELLHLVDHILVDLRIEFNVPILTF